MKSYIKYIIESLFDDDDVQLDNSIADKLNSKLILKIINQLTSIPENRTTYPKDINNIYFYENATNIAQELTTIIQKKSEYLEPYFKITFLDEYSEFHIAMFNQINNVILLFYIDKNKHISLLVLTPGSPLCESPNNYVDTFTVSLDFFIELIYNGYQIDSYNIVYEKAAYGSIKYAARYILNVEDIEHIITSDIVNKLPAFENTLNLQYAYPTKYTNFDSEETYIKFLTYLKECGFVNFEYNSYIAVKINGLKDIAKTIFLDFALKNNLTILNLTTDIPIILHEVEPYIKQFCIDNLRFDNDSSTKYTYYALVDHNVHTDDNGKFIYVEAELNYRDTDNKYRCIVLQYKVYSNGFIEFVKILSGNTDDTIFGNK